MTAYAIAKSLLIPPGILILMLACAFLLVRGVLGRILLFVATAVFALMCMPAVATLLMEPLEPYPALAASGPFPPKARAILVLGSGRHSGAPEYGGDTVDGFSMERLRYGAFLQRATGLPLYVSGGILPGEEPPPVGVLMAKVLKEELGVPVAGVESQSRDTWENVAFSKALLEREGISHVLLVTSAWHLPRAVDACQRAGLAVTPAPTGFVGHRLGEGEGDLGDWMPSAAAFASSYYAVHEHLGRVWYQIRHWIQGAPGVAVAPAAT